MIYDLSQEAILIIKKLCLIRKILKKRIIASLKVDFYDFLMYEMQ